MQNETEVQGPAARKTLFTNRNAAVYDYLSLHMYELDRHLHKQQTKRKRAQQKSFVLPESCQTLFLFFFANIAKDQIEPFDAPFQPTRRKSQRRSNTNQQIYKKKNFKNYVLARLTADGHFIFVGMTHKRLKETTNKTKRKNTIQRTIRQQRTQFA